MPALAIAEARERFGSARVARLATVAPDGAPHVVPIVFAVVRAGEVDRLISAVDHKPKSTRSLRRLAHIEDEPRVSLLVDEYAEDWSRLWWVRADGVARVYADPPDGLGALIAKYDQYAAVPPAGPFVVVEVTRWTGWTGGGRREGTTARRLGL